MFTYNKHIIILTSLIIGLLSVSLSATQVPMERAKEIARSAYALKSNIKVKRAQDIQVVETYTQMTEDKEAYYIFNMQPQGFVVVSAEDNYNAILAFSDEGAFDWSDAEKSWPALSTLGKHERRIAYNRANNIKPTPSISKEWDVLNTYNINQAFGKNDPEGMVIAPLTTTKWNQGEYYNAFTPRDADPNSIAGGTYCGCAPMAMAQLIKYHNYPPTGNGAISYEDPQYGELSVDFCRDYNWANMPDSLSGPNTDVAEFIYHVGASTRTEYSTTYTSTFVSYIRDALVEYWNYDEAADWFYDANGDFADVAIRDLNQGRPVMLTGDAYTNGVFAGAHAWVADGYGYFLNPTGDMPDEYFHFNWGWGGDNNGWFLETDGSWDPIPNTFGTYSITYWYDRYVVHNIFPAENNCGAPKSLYTSQITTNSAYLNTDYITDYDQVFSFRFREVGTTAWTESNPSTNYYTRARFLDADTEYEYQVRKQCCDGNWSDYGELMTFRTEAGVALGPCDTFIPSSLSTSSLTENNAYLLTSRPYGQVDNQFRYRFVGSLVWTYSTINTNYWRFISNLQSGTQYEYQVRHACELNEWTNFGSSSFFTTPGVVSSCIQEYEVNLFTSSTTETGTYIYSSQPYGRVDNQFRYRPTGSTQWTESAISNSYYRYISNLLPGTEYEFQVSHNCGGADWSDWSFSHTFTTLGSTLSDCDPIDGSRMYVSSVLSDFAYVYTPQPYGQVANQFRYRPLGSTTWQMTSVATLYYRALTDLNETTVYEFQVSHECQIGQWSDWSASNTFATLSGFTGSGGEIGRILPPAESPLFSESMLEAWDVTVFPNPASTIVHVQTSRNFSENADLLVMDVTGKEVGRQSISEGSVQIDLDVSDLEQGLYMLIIRDDMDQIVKRVVVR